MKIEHKIFEAAVKTFDDENLIVEHFISTEHKDRGGDIMRAKGMKIVGKPVVLMLHGRGPMASEPIAKPLSITIDEFKGQPGILAKTQFFNDEVGQRLYQKIKGGFIPNWSIGYSVDEAKDIVEAGRYAGRDVTKWQLFEYSPVGVPMNPFAQTIKEFLDKTEKGEEVEFGEGDGWFGIVEEKTCTGCGACHGKPGECKTCKGPLTHFAKGDTLLGSTCEKCQPEEFARLQKEIEPPADPPPDPMKAIDEKIAALEEKVATWGLSMTHAVKGIEDLTDALKKLEPLLKTLPPEPEGGDKGKESEGNPPEEKTPPRLVFSDLEGDERKRKANEAAATVEIIRGAIRPVFQDQVDRLLGKVN